MWEDAIGNEFRQRQGGEYVIVIPDEEGYFEIDIIMPYRLLPPSADQPTYIWVVYAIQTAQVGSPHLSDDFKLIVEQMIVTIFIGMMATLFGIVFAVPISFLAARNLMSAIANHGWDLLPHAGDIEYHPFDRAINLGNRDDYCRRLRAFCGYSWL